MTVTHNDDVEITGSLDVAGPINTDGYITAGSLAAGTNVGIGITDQGVVSGGGTGDTYGLSILWHRTSGGANLGDYQVGGYFWNQLNYSGSDTTGPLVGLKVDNLLLDGNIGESGTTRNMVGLHVTNDAQGNGVIYGDQITLQLEQISYSTVSGNKILLYLYERTTPDYAVYQSGTGPWRIGGKVGIGCTPTMGFQVQGTDYASSVSGFYRVYNSNSGPEFRFVHSRGSGVAGQDGDTLASVVFYGYNDAGTPEQIAYGIIQSSVLDASDGTEDGQLLFRNYDAGSLQTTFVVRGDGFYLPALPTESLEVMDAGSVGATAQDWVTVKVGGNTGYIRIYSSK